MLYIKTRYDETRGGRTVEAESAAGWHIRDLLVEAVALANKLEVGVEFDFKGRLVWVKPGADPEHEYRRFCEYWAQRDAFERCLKEG